MSDLASRLVHDAAEAAEQHGDPAESAACPECREMASDVVVAVLEALAADPDHERYSGYNMHDLRRLAERVKEARNG